MTSAVLSSFLLWAMAAFAQVSAAPVPEKAGADSIILVGDSTVAANSGWGQAFCETHVRQGAECLNLARSGRSSRTFISEGFWAGALTEIRRRNGGNVWVLIQFGHNDQGKTYRSTDPDAEFRDNILRFVRDVRASGAKPVLVTPVTRRTFIGDRLDNTLEPWAQSIRAVAQETETPLVDLNADSVAAVQEMGPKKAALLAQLPPGSQPRRLAASDGSGKPGAYLAFDKTHLGARGATIFARMVTRDLVREVPAMRPLLQFAAANDN